MIEEKNEQAVSVSKIVILSMLGTIALFGALLFTFEAELKHYLLRDLKTEVANMIPPATEYPSSEERVVSAIDRVNPAVVSVVVTKEVPVYEQFYETINPWGLFDGFTVPRLRENGTEEREIGGGSGFLVTTDGLIVTNRHVVDDEEANYTVVLNDGSFYSATVVDRDPQLDIAILQITELPERQLPTVSFGDSESLQLGQTVIAIGNALAEFQNSVSLGIVSGLSRSIVASDVMGNAEQLNQVIQTDAAINPGNSGGPLLNLDGEVVGVNVATSRGADNIGFALPAHIVERVVASVREYGEIVRPFLGVRYVMVDAGVQEEFSLPVSYGALLINGSDGQSSVEPGSPAFEAGLASGDVILSIDGVQLRNNDLATELRNKLPGDTVELEVLTAGETRTIPVTLTQVQ